MDCRVPLHNQKGAIVAHALVSPEDYERVSCHPWYLGAKYVQRVPWQPKGISRTTILLHRFVLSALSGKHVDHINGNPLDNRQENLRFATSAQNQRNRRMITTNTSGYKGVIWDRNRHKWSARVKLSSKTFYGGLYDSIVDAARAYDVLALKLHGEFAVTNADLGLLKEY